MSDILKDAIVDAKQVREAAMANAKQILAEQMSTQLSSLVSKQIEEMEAPIEEEQELTEAPVTETIKEEEEIEITDDTEVVPVEGTEEEVIETPAEEAAPVSEEEIDVDAVLAELEKEEEAGPELEEEAKDCVKEETTVQLEARMNKATGLIKRLKDQLVEANTLNGKLVYLTKLFKNYSFSKDQKERMVEIFDRSNSINELKLTYDILVESINANKKVDVSKKKITEGLASKMTKATQEKSKSIINENQQEDYITRVQKLAGIKTVKNK